MGGQLEGKVAIVTGGASGIGLASVRAFLREGASVVAGDISDAYGAELVGVLGDAFMYRHADVTDESQIEALIEAAVERFGKLDVMFNNAGAAGDLAPIVDLTEEGFQATISLILRSAFFGHKYAARQFRKQRTGGSIITTASLAGLQGGWSPAAYNMGKHGIVGLVKQATAEMAGDGIRSNAIAPGITMTRAMGPIFGVPPERTDEFIEFIAEVAAKQQPVPRAGRPEDIAEAAVFFASDASSFVSGQTLAVDGGATTVYAGRWLQLAVEAGDEFRNRV